MRPSKRRLPEGRLRPLERIQPVRTREGNQPRRFAAVADELRQRHPEAPADALAYVAGYMVANDVSERSLQIERSGGQWSKGKSCETFSPLGLWLVPADDVEDLIDTGTPAGVAMSGRFPFLRPGEVVECEVDGLGRQRVVIEAASGP